MAVLPISTLLQYATALRYRSINETKPNQTIEVKKEKKSTRKNHTKYREKWQRDRESSRFTHNSQLIVHDELLYINLNANALGCMLFGATKFVCSIEQYKKTKQNNEKKIRKTTTATKSRKKRVNPSFFIVCASSDTFLFP